MDHFVDEMGLAFNIGFGEIVAVMLGARMKVEVAHRSHRHAPRLQGKELAASDRHASIVDCSAEHRTGKSNLTLREGPCAADGAVGAGEESRPIRCRFRKVSVGGVFQRSSPAARTGASTVVVVPSDRVKVTLAVPPAISVSAGSNAIT